MPRGNINKHNVYHFFFFRHSAKVFVANGSRTMLRIFSDVLLQRLHWKVRAFRLWRLPWKQKQILDHVSVSEHL